MGQKNGGHVRKHLGPHGKRFWPARDRRKEHGRDREALFVARRRASAAQG